jgi:hypothetical protein
MLHKGVVKKLEGEIETLRAEKAEMKFAIREAYAKSIEL